MTLPLRRSVDPHTVPRSDAVGLIPINAELGTLCFGSSHVEAPPLRNVAIRHRRHPTLRGDGHCSTLLGLGTRLWYRARYDGLGHGLQRHTAQRIDARVVLPDLRVHRTSIDGARGCRGRFRGWRKIVTRIRYEFFTTAVRAEPINLPVDERPDAWRWRDLRSCGKLGLSLRLRPALSDDWHDVDVRT